MAHSYEIEVKSLLGSKENCDKLKSALWVQRPGMKLAGASKQLNHYNAHWTEYYGTDKTFVLD